MRARALDTEHAQHPVAEDQRRSATRRQPVVGCGIVVNTGCFARRKSVADRIAFERNDLAGKTWTLVIGKIKRSDAQLVCRLVVKRQGRSLVRHDRAQRNGNRLQQLAQIQIRDERVVNLQQQLRTVALVRQLFTIKLTFNRNRDLRRNQLCEFEIESVVSAGLFAPKIQGAELLMNRAQRQTTN